MILAMPFFCRRVGKLGGCIFWIPPTGRPQSPGKIFRKVLRPAASPTAAIARLLGTRVRQLKRWWIYCRDLGPTCFINSTKVDALIGHKSPRRRPSLVHMIGRRVSENQDKNLVRRWALRLCN
jgi:hypothetical protein